MLAFRKLTGGLRVATIFVSIFLFLTHMGVVWLLVRDRWRRTHLANRLLQSWAHWGLWVLNVKVHAAGREYLAGIENALFVGNHLSYLDVLVISNQQPVCFVTSTEIQHTHLLGQICRMAGCLFVERRNKFNIHNEVAELSEGLRHGLSVAIFPEATSTNGEQILRFRRPLFIAAIDADRPVVPFCLNYRTVGGRPINRRTRDSVMWYGDMPFAPHLWALASSGGIEAELIFLPPMTTDGREAADLAAGSQAAVESSFRPVTLD